MVTCTSEPNKYSLRQFGPKFQIESVQFMCNKYTPYVDMYSLVCVSEKVGGNS